MRWADVDLLGHINNVVYVDYLQEARVDMLRTHGPAVNTGALAEGVVVVRHEISYLAPLHFGPRPVSIESWVTEIRPATFTIAYEIFHEEDHGERHVYARAKTLLTPYIFATERPRRLSERERTSLAVFLEPEEAMRRPPLPSGRPEGALHYPVQVRFSDVDAYGHVNNVKYVEFFQEARVSGLAQLWQGLERAAFVVSRIEVDYRVPILFRPEPYDAWSWISHVGQRSATIESIVVDGDAVLARARVTIVFYDRDTERSTVPSAAHLDRLRSLSHSGAAD